MWVWWFFKTSAWLGAASLGISALSRAARGAAQDLHGAAMNAVDRDFSSGYELNSHALAWSGIAVALSNFALVVSITALAASTVAFVGHRQGKLVLPWHRADMQVALDALVVGLADIERRAERGTAAAAEAEALISMTKEQVAAIKKGAGISNRLSVVLFLAGALLTVAIAVWQLYLAGDLPRLGQ